jgi:hypothetical protein
MNVSRRKGRKVLTVDENFASFAVRYIHHASSDYGFLNAVSYNPFY